MQMETAATTPPFLVWALEHACPLRNIDRWTEPERTERHLRAVVEVAKGVNERRVIDGVCLGAECLDESLPQVAWTGFAVDEALAMFGGRELVAATCGGCPANVLRESQPAALGSCHGLLPLPQFEAWTEDARQKWFRSCATSPLQSGMNFAAEIFALIAGQFYADANRAEVAHFVGAVNCCEAENIPLHVRMFPAGRIEGRRWILPQTCLTCGAAWQENEGCRWCSAKTPSGGELKRHTRGIRPYLPLTKFLTGEEVEALVSKLRAQEAQRKAAARELYRQTLANE